MKKLLILLPFLIYFGPSSHAQDDSTLAYKGEALMTLYTLIHKYDSSSLLYGYHSSDSATFQLVDFGLKITTLAPNEYFDYFITAPTFEDTLKPRITVQNSQLRVVIDDNDSTVFIYDKDSNVNVTEIPLMNSLYTGIYMRDVSLSSENDSINKLTILFNPDTKYKRMELLYDRSTFQLKLITGWSDAVRYPSLDENVPGVPYTRVWFFDILAEAHDPSLKLSNPINKFIYKNQDSFFTQPAYSGYRLITVLNND